LCLLGAGILYIKRFTASRAKDPGVTVYGIFKQPRDNSWLTWRFALVHVNHT